MSEANETCPAELPNWCAQRHWSIFWILIVCSVAMVSARVLTLTNPRTRDSTPFFSANDRSRWTTVRALGDDNTYVIDGPITEDSPYQWDTIDKVRHVDADGVMHFYSSKPPLLATLVAGLYKPLKLITGWEISTQPFYVVRTLLLLVNVIPWAIFLWCVARMSNSVPVRDWARYYVLACAAFGTYLATFTITLNNHLPAAIAVMVALYLVSEIVRKKTVDWFFYAMAGLASSFAAVNEMPAMAFLACAGLVCMIRSWQKTVLAFVPAAIVVAAAFFATNYLAHGTWRPAYSKRSDGPVLTAGNGDFAAELDQGKLPAAIEYNLPAELGFQRPTVESGHWPSTPAEVQRWVVRDEITSAQLAIVSSDENNFELRAWGNWYDYPGSYWLASNDGKKSEVDRGQSSVPLYLFHCLFGHHGIFSLTPIWLLSFAGMVALLFGAKMGGSYQMRWLGALGLVLTIVVIAFYVSRPAIDRNYGGVSCVLRWLLWLVPIWLMTMLPIVDWLAATRWGKFVCFVLLFISVVSAMLPANNPWTHPWLYEIWEMTGLPK